MASFFKFIILGLFAASLEAIGLPGGNIATRNVFVSMSQGTGPVLDVFDQRVFATREEKLTALTNVLQSHASLTQDPILKFLNSPAATFVNGGPITFETMWISNQIYMKGVNSGLLSTLASTFPSQIAALEDETFFYPTPVNVSEKQRGRGNAWGVPKIQAPQAWNQGARGQGIVVGVIDTGVRESHQALRGNYVGAQNFGWYDPGRQTRTPVDNNGHGTHCAGKSTTPGGTILGTTNNIGVAPQAKWMACIGCGGQGASCSSFDLQRCGEFMACPHDYRDRNNKNCGKAPHVVSNSWGGPRSRGYDSIIRSWRSAGIIPVFAAGNEGPNCDTIGSPGDNADVIAVGSTTSQDGLSDFSSKGPGPFGTKPDVSAPGSDIYSASHRGDSSYTTMSGTSMACPHVAGVVALMLSANRGMKYDQVRNALFNGCVTSGLRQPSKRCGRSSGNVNNEFGRGLVNALNSVQNSKS